MAASGVDSMLPKDVMNLLPVRIRTLMPVEDERRERDSLRTRIVRKNKGFAIGRTETHKARTPTTLVCADVRGKFMGVLWFGRVACADEDGIRFRDKSSDVGGQSLLLSHVELTIFHHRVRDWLGNKISHVDVLWAVSKYSAVRGGKDYKMYKKSTYPSASLTSRATK